MSNEPVETGSIQTKFPYVSLITVLVVSIAVSVGLLWKSSTTQESYAHLVALTGEVNAELGTVALSDEILSTSVRLAAITGQEDWSKRYNDTVPMMDGAMARIGELAPQELVDVLNAETGAANDVLIGLEDKAFTLIGESKTAEALSVLDSADYTNAKKALLDGSVKFEGNLLDLIEEQQVILKEEGDTSFLISIGAILVIVISWGVLFMTLKNWQRSLKEAEQETIAKQARQEERQRQEQEDEHRRQREQDEERKHMLMQMADHLETTVGSVVSSVTQATQEMNASATSMVATSEETISQAANVASSANEASGNVGTVASAAEELSASISEIGRQVNQASDIAKKAVVDAETTNGQIVGLADAAQKIGEVVSLITNIADQTNLLALNATIEAARAGDAGKGFAVVASEVKNLANQTAKATEDITGQINSIQNATKDSVVAVQGIGDTIGEIENISTAIAAAVEEQGSATQEIARNVDQASAGTQAVSGEISSVSSSAQKTGEASRVIVSGTSELSSKTRELEAEVSSFLGELRSS